MAGWDDGYVTDVTYTTNFYREMTPLWLATTCLLLGQRPPDLTRPFRWADLGCGNGATALIVAATHPEAEIWGFDFNPSHIEWANRMASAAGLANAHFVEASFAELMARPDGALPPFDFMIAHGVASWISPANRRLMIELMHRQLRPGGIAYVSYNVSTAWAPMVPLRRLMCMLQATTPARTDVAVSGMLDFIDRMKAGGALFFHGNPRVDDRIKELRNREPRYIAHEYLNRDWHPLMFADVAAEMTEAKCSFVGSATLTENVDALAVPEGMVPLLNEMPDRVLRETLRDFAASQAFRRDVYRRGLSPMPATEQTAMLEALTLAPVGVTVPDPITFTTPVGTVTGRSEVYRPLFDMMAGPSVATLRQMRAAEVYAGRSMVDLLQAVMLMIAGGYAHPVVPGAITAPAREAAARLNQAIAGENANGSELPFVAAPLTGSALHVDLLETLMVADLLAGASPDLAGMTESVMSGLERSGRTMQREGKPVTDRAEARGMAAQVVERFLERRMPVLRTLGVVS